MVKYATMCYLIKNNKVLLQYKSKGLFGEGWWNGPGGKILEGETPEDCAKREVLEEVGMRVSNFKKCGYLTFLKNNEPFFVCHVFITNEFEGTPKGGREGDVKWFDFNEIPYENMWPDDKIWMPIMLQGKNFEGTFYFGESFKELVKHEIKVI